MSKRDSRGALMKKMGLVFSLLIGLYLLLTAGCPASKSSTSVEATFSELRVSGNRIVNEEGKEIRLRGVHFTDPFVLEKDDLNQDGVPDNHFADIVTDFVRVKALGANVVRVAIYPGFYQLVGGESYLSRYVDRLIDLAQKNKLYIILSYQVIGQPGGWYFSGADSLLQDYPAKIHYTDHDMVVAFWNTVAARYGQRKHVLFEMYNEPADDTTPFTWTDWRPTGELLIATIRKHSDNIILGSATEYSSDLSAVSGNPYSDSNLIYVAHIYPITAPEGKDQVPEWERRFGFLAKTYPVIVSEWGFHDGTTDEVVNGTIEGYARPLIDYLNQKNIHWVAFVYHPPDAEPPMLESDWTTLNEFGKFVKESLGGSSSITVISPNGGEKWRRGRKVQIVWSSTGIAGDVHVELSFDGGTIWKPILTQTPNDGQERWRVKTRKTTQAMLRIISASDPSISDTSDTVFTIR